MEQQEHERVDDDKSDLLSGLKGVASQPLDGDAETQAAEARKPFDTAGDFKVPDVPVGHATPFFGDSMPISDLSALVDPENDPRVVDLRQAKTFLVDTLKSEDGKQEAFLRTHQMEEERRTVASPKVCTELARKLEGYLEQRQRFQKTVYLAQEQLDTWQSANRNALMAAARDGLEYFTGKLLDGLTKRGEAAARLQRILDKNAAKMLQEGIDVGEIEGKIKHLRMLSSAGSLSELRSNLSDWQGFINDGASTLLAQLSSSNQEIQTMLDDPRLREYFVEDAPALNALLDISKIAAASKVFGKWVAKKMPVIAAAELTVNQAYNALDWSLSFKRIIEDNKINGQVLVAAQSLQGHIDDTFLALKDCH